MDVLIKRLRAAGLYKKILPDKKVGTWTEKGIGAFVPQIRKVVLHYNHPRHAAGGDSAGMVEFIKKDLIPLAKDRQYVEFCVQPRNKSPPELIAYYVNGTIKRHVCYKLTATQIRQHMNYLCDTAGVGSKEEPQVEEVKPEGFVRQRKFVRGHEKLTDIDLKTTGKTDWQTFYKKKVKHTDWKKVGRPWDKRFARPVIRAAPENSWNPYAGPLFKP
ncbi:39S ribosomal protein L43, mitochondrial [Irineochytrium annulatum]|nr:39S ribosomal protein L43, mitochondrial [Irineochytrium annulatum]